MASRRSSSRRRSSVKRRSTYRNVYPMRQVRNSLKDGFDAARELNLSAWRRVGALLGRDGVHQYLALRKSALFFAMSFWTYFGALSMLCHMADECRPLETTLKGIERLNGVLYFLMFGSLLYGTTVFLLSAFDLMYKSALMSMEGSGRSVIKGGRVVLRNRRITAGGDPEFMSSTMIRPRYKVDPVYLPTADLPPPARQTAAITYKSRSASRRPGAAAGGGSQTEKAPYSRRRSRAGLSRRASRQAAQMVRQRRRTNQSLARVLPTAGNPIVRRKSSAGLHLPPKLVKMRAHSPYDEVKNYYARPGTIAKQKAAPKRTLSPFRQLRKGRKSLGL